MSNILTERVLRPDDAAAVAEITAAIERVDPVDETLSEQDVIDEMSAPGVDLARASIGILDGDRLVGFGWLRVSPLTESWKAYQWAGVQPDYVGGGIGHRIIAQLEAAAAAMRDADAPGVPGEMKIWVDAERPRTASLVDAVGYQTWRYFFRMRCDLGRPINPVTDPAGVQIRGYSASDDELVRQLSNETFADHWGSTPMDAERWRADFADSSSSRPLHSLVALVDGTIVGFLLVAEFEADTRHRGYSTGYIARVGTRRSARGRGIAGALLARALRRLADDGYRYAELGVDADSPTGAGRLYERAGFVTISRNRVVGKHF